MAAVNESWKRSGLLRGPGIPAPSGSFSVGCVDLMHKFEDETDSLLVRLFYPCDGNSEGRYQYAPWSPHKRYTKGYLEYKKSSAPGLFSAVIRTFTAPKVPALYGAPLVTPVPKSVPETVQPTDPSEQPSSQEGTNATTANDKTEGADQDDPSHVDAVVKGGENDETEETTVAGATPPADMTNQSATTSSDSTDNATPTADPATCAVPDHPIFPVIVYSHGLGAMRTSYSAICSDLASHGYIVGAMDHRDRSACISMRRVPKPGGREGELQDDWLEHYHLQEGESEFPLRNGQVKQRAVDAKRTLDLLGLLNDGGEVGNMLGVNFDFHQFQGRMDIGTAAIMGHSFGGATTVQTLSEDKRFKCGIGLDAWMLPIHKDVYENGSVVEQPLLFINSFNFQWKENIQQMSKMTKPSNEDGITTCRLMTLKGTTHYYQTDVLFVLSKMFSGKAVGPLDPTTGHEVNMDICNGFLKRHLLLDPAYQLPLPNLDGCEGHSEHVLFGTNVDISEDQGAGQGERVTPVPEVGVVDEGAVEEPVQEGNNADSDGQRSKVAEETEEHTHTQLED